MTDRIEPAISAEDWKRRTKGNEGVSLRFPGPFADAVRTTGIVINTAWAPQAIALANDALPDADPRKIARQWVEALRKEAARGEEAERHGDNAGYSAIDPFLARQMADALESYLPPE